MRSAVFTALTLFAILLHSSVQAALFDCTHRVNRSAVLKDAGMVWKFDAVSAGRNTARYTVKAQSRTNDEEQDITLFFGTGKFISRLLCGSRITGLNAQDTDNGNIQEKENDVSPCSKILNIKPFNASLRDKEEMRMDYISSTFRVLKWQRDNDVLVSIKLKCQKDASRQHLRVFAQPSCKQPEGSQDHSRTIPKNITLIPCGETAFVMFHRNSRGYTYINFEVIDCMTGQLLKTETNSIIVRIESEKSSTLVAKHNSECRSEKFNHSKLEGKQTRSPAKELGVDFDQSSKLKPIFSVSGLDTSSGDASSVSVDVDGGTMSHSQDDHSSLENSANASGNTVSISINLPPVFPADNGAVHQQRVGGIDVNRPDSTSVEAVKNITSNTGKNIGKTIRAVQVLPNGLPVKEIVSSRTPTFFRILPGSIFTGRLQIEVHKPTSPLTGQVVTDAGIRPLNFSGNTASVNVCPNEIRHGVNITLVSHVDNPIEVSVMAKFTEVQELVDSVQLELHDAPQVVAVPLTGWPEDGAVLRADMRGQNCIRLQMYRALCQALRGTSDFISSHTVSGDMGLALDSSQFSRRIAFLRYQPWYDSGLGCADSSLGTISSIGRLSVIEGPVMLLWLFLPPIVSLIVSAIGFVCGRRWIRAFASGCDRGVIIQELPPSPTLTHPIRLPVTEPDEQTENPHELVIAASAPPVAVSTADEITSIHDTYRITLPPNTSTTKAHKQEDNSAVGELTLGIPQTSAIHPHQLTLSCSVEKRIISSLFPRPSWALMSISCCILLLSFSQQLLQANACRTSTIILLTYPSYGFMSIVYCALTVLPMVASLGYLRNHWLELTPAFVSKVVRIWPGQEHEWLLIGYWVHSMAYSMCPGTQTLLPSNIFLAIFFWAATGITGDPPTSRRLHQAVGMAAALALPSWFPHPWNIVLKALLIPSQMLVAVYGLRIALSPVCWRDVRLWLVSAAAVNGAIAAVSWPFSADVHLLLTVIFNRILVSLAYRRCGAPGDNASASIFFGNSQLLSAAAGAEAAPPALFWRRRLQLVALISLVSAVALREFPSIVQDLMVDPPQLVCVLYSLTFYLVHISN